MVIKLQVGAHKYPTYRYLGNLPLCNLTWLRSLDANNLVAVE